VKGENREIGKASGGEGQWPWSDQFHLLEIEVLHKHISVSNMKSGLKAKSAMGETRKVRGKK